VTRLEASISLCPNCAAVP